MKDTTFDSAEFVAMHKMKRTKPRLLVADLLFRDGVNKHISAEWVVEQLKKSDTKIALATVYNTLHSFKEAGLLKQVTGMEGNTIVFDTNTAPHHHLYNEITGELIDIPEDVVNLEHLPELPAGTSIVNSTLIVRIR